MTDTVGRIHELLTEDGNRLDRQQLWGREEAVNGEVAGHIPDVGWGRKVNIPFISFELKGEFLHWRINASCACEYNVYISINSERIVMSDNRNNASIVTGVGKWHLCLMKIKSMKQEHV